MPQIEASQSADYLPSDVTQGTTMRPAVAREALSWLSAKYSH